MLPRRLSYAVTGGDATTLHESRFVSMVERSAQAGAENDLLLEANERYRVVWEAWKSQSLCNELQQHLKNGSLADEAIFAI